MHLISIYTSSMLSSSRRQAHFNSAALCWCHWISTSLSPLYILLLHQLTTTPSHEFSHHLALSHLWSSSPGPCLCLPCLFRCFHPSPRFLNLTPLFSRCHSGDRCSIYRVDLKLPASSLGLISDMEKSTTEEKATYTSDSPRPSSTCAHRVHHKVIQHQS